MKAAVYTRYGPPDVVQITDAAKPVPNHNEVLIKVGAASVNPLDWRIMRGGPLLFRMLVGLRKPREPRVGRDVAGLVEAVGKSVTQLKPGDEVFGACRGAFAEYACARESALARKPKNISFEQAASLPVAGLTALQGLRDTGKIRAGQRLLINGATGGVGTFAVQIAKTFGAHVTGVCSTGKVDLVRSLGADRVIDYTQEDFTQAAERYDLILDNVGNHSLSACRRVLRPHGLCVIAGGPKDPGAILARSFKLLLLSRLPGQPFAFFVARLNQKDLAVLSELMQAGKVTPVIDRQYALSEVAEALRYVDEGHARGKVIIEVDRL